MSDECTAANSSLPKCAVLTVLQAAMGGGGMAGPGPDALAAAEAQVPPHLLEAMQHGMNNDDEELLADLLGNIPPDQAAELRRLVQEGRLVFEGTMPVCWRALVHGCLGSRAAFAVEQCKSGWLRIYGCAVTSVQVWSPSKLQLGMQEGDRHDILAQSILDLVPYCYK